MSIWTDLLFLHGHVATSTALALLAPTCAAATAVAPPGEAPAAEASSSSIHPPPPVHHALRTICQLR